MTVQLDVAQPSLGWLSVEPGDLLQLGEGERIFR